MVGKQYLSFSSLVREDSLRSTGRSLSEPGVRAASGGRTQAGKARGLRCRRPHGSGGEAKAGGAPGLSFWAKTAPESRWRAKESDGSQECKAPCEHLPSLPPGHLNLLPQLYTHLTPPYPALTECGAAQASKGPVREGSQGGEACGTPKGICGRKGDGQSLGQPASSSYQELTGRGRSVSRPWNPQPLSSNNQVLSTSLGQEALTCVCAV